MEPAVGDIIIAQNARGHWDSEEVAEVIGSAFRIVSKRPRWYTTYGPWYTISDQELEAYFWALEGP